MLWSKHTDCALSTCSDYEADLDEEILILVRPLSWFPLASATSKSRGSLEKLGHDINDACESGVRDATTSPRKNDNPVMKEVDKAHFVMLIHIAALLLEPKKYF